MTSTPKRRWFRFSLRTLFVAVTVFGCWLGYQMNWIRQRHVVLKQQNVGKYFDTQGEDPLQAYPFPIAVANPINAPWPLWMLGQRGVARIDIIFTGSDVRNLNALEESEWLRVKRLFPEAEVTAGVYPAIDANLP
jgi:hypothetical protein